MEKYLYWFAHRKPYIPYKTMVKKIGSTYSSSNMHVIVDDNGYSYRSMVMDAIIMN